MYSGTHEPMEPEEDRRATQSSTRGTLLNFFSPGASLDPPQISEFDADIVGATTISGQASSPVRMRQALAAATYRADEFAKQGNYTAASIAEEEVKKLEAHVSSVKVQWEMVVQAKKKVAIAIASSERKREWLQVGKFKHLQKVIEEKLEEHKQREAERKREKEVSEEQARKEASEKRAQEARKVSRESAQPVSHRAASDGEASELVPHLHDSERYRVAARTYVLKDDEKVGRGKGKNSECTVEQFNSCINKEYTFEGVRYPNLHGHSLIRDAGHLFCACCSANVGIYHARQHCHGDFHKDKLEWFNKRGAEMRTIAQHVEGIQESRALVGRTLDSDTKAFRGEVLFFLADGNYSVNSLYKTKPRIEQWASKQMGDPKALHDLTPAVHELEINNIRAIVVSCFREYGAAWDGDPLYAEAEVMFYRGVRVTDWKIMNVCLGIKLLKKSPTSRTLFLSLDSVLQRSGLTFNEMKVAMLDRAKTNSCSLRIVTEERNARVLGAYCGSHNLGNCGKQFEGDELDTFLHYFKEMVMHPGGARLRFTELFGENAKNGVGVRWFLQHEQLHQLNSIGFERILEWADWCHRNDYSEKSSAKLVAIGKDPVKMAKVIVQAAARDNAGEILCKGCYNLEGNNPLVFVVHEELLKIERYIDDGMPLPLLEPACAKAEAQIKLVVAAAEADWRSSLGREAALQAHVATLEQQLHTAEGLNVGGIEGRRVKGKQNYAQLAVSGRVEEAQDTERARLAREIKSKKAELLLATTDVSSKSRIKDERVAAIGPKTAAEFYAIGRASTDPAFVYYRRLYLQIGGDMFLLRQAFRGVSLLNPMKLRDMQVNEARLLLQDFRHFGFAEFTTEFIEGLDSELKLLLEQARQPFDWGAVPDASEYDASVRRRCVADNEDSILSAWMQDPGEKGRRILEWWVVRLNGHDYFKYFKVALRLVVLVQPSSAIVERANSRLKQIIECIGEHSLAETLEFRAFRALNKQ